MEETFDFNRVQQLIEQDLLDSGFNSSQNPPGKEPALPAQVGTMSLQELRDLYDAYLAFYEYLTNQLVQLIPKLAVVQEQLIYKEAKARLRIAKDKEFTNEALRDAAISIDDKVLDARLEVRTINGIKQAQEERRNKMSKTMERLYRELVLREQPNYKQLPRFMRVHDRT